MQQSLMGISRRDLLALALLFSAGCSLQPAEPVRAGTYKDTPEELRRLWTDILFACQKDDRARIKELMASFVMTQDELATLFGSATAKALWPRYQSMLSAMTKIGAVELTAHVYEKKYDDIAVNRVDDKPAAEQVETDRNIARALIAPQPFYSVRVKRKNEIRGLRYDFFIYMNGYWRSGSLLGKYLTPPPPLPSPIPSPTPSKTPPPAPAAPAPAAPMQSGVEKTVSAP